MPSSSAMPSTPAQWPARQVQPLAAIVGINLDDWGKMAFLRVGLLFRRERAIMPDDQ